MPAGGLLAGSIAAPIIGGVIGNMASAADRAAAQGAMQAAFEQINAIGAPPDLSAKIIYEQFKKVGVLTPELEQAINIGVSKESEIKEDPALRNAQMGALQLLQQRGKTGLGAEDRAALNQIRAETQRDTEAKRQQILQNMQARGMGGSGAELVAQLQASQAGADTASQQGDAIAAQASQNALQALMQSSQLGGQVRGQDYDVNSARARAADEFKKFDVQNAINQQERNVGRKQDTNLYNLSESQRLSDTNTQVENQERLRQVEAKRQHWLDQLGLAQAKAGALTGQAGMYQGQAGQTAQMWQGIGSGVGAGAGAGLNYMNTKALLNASQANRNQTAQNQQLNNQMQQASAGVKNFKLTGQK